jgi:hypothetical protein
MRFMQLDQGVVVRKEMGRDAPRIVRLLIGNPLVMNRQACARCRFVCVGYSPCGGLTKRRKRRCDVWRLRGPPMR